MFITKEPPRHTIRAITCAGMGMAEAGRRAAPAGIGPRHGRPVQPALLQQGGRSARARAAAAGPPAGRAPGLVPTGHTIKMGLGWSAMGGREARGLPRPTVASGPRGRAGDRHRPRMGLQMNGSAGRSRRKEGAERSAKGVLAAMSRQRPQRLATGGEEQALHMGPNMPSQATASLQEALPGNSRHTKTRPGGVQTAACEWAPTERRAPAAASGLFRRKPSAPTLAPRR